MGEEIECQNLAARFNAPNAPCYLLRRYEEEVRSVEPSRWQAFWESLSFFSSHFDFDEDGLSLRFTMPGLRNRPKGFKMIIAFGGPFVKVDDARKRRLPFPNQEFFNRYYQFSQSGVFIAYCGVQSNGKAGCPPAAVARLTQRFIRYAILRGFVDPDHVYVFGAGDDAFGGRTAAYVASCIPDSFAGLYTIDADVSPYITPQLANMGVYVQLSAEFSGPLYDKIAQINAALTEIGVSRRVTLDETPHFNGDILTEMLTKKRIAFPPKIAFRIFDANANYSLYYVGIPSQSFRGGETAVITRCQTNKYKIESESKMKIEILANESVADFNSPISICAPNRVFRFENPFESKSNETLNRCLEAKGDFSLAFSVRFLVEF